MQATACPPAEQLKAYLSGKLDADASDVLAQHLLSCESCERTAANIELDPDTLVKLLQADLEDSPVNKAPENNHASNPASDRSGNNAGISADVSAGIHESILPGALGQYEFISRLGSGGMGAVYLARHRSLDKQVAVKLLPALPSGDAEFVARFQREMRAAGRLDHPAIVRTTDAGEQQGVHFLVMEVIDGMNLSTIARLEEKLSIADACEVARQAALGLAHAHEKGIVHRDIKPSNLMLDTNGKVRILDFGLAQMGMWDSGSAEITSVGQLMGTLDYMAPEQAERGGAVDYRADLYSLGATLFRLLTGRAPLAAAPNLTPLEKLRLLATHKPPKLRSLRPDVPEELSQIVDSMLARDPARRPASAVHAAELLEPFADQSDLVDLLRRARSKPADESTPQEHYPAIDPWLQRSLMGEALAPAAQHSIHLADPADQHSPTQAQRETAGQGGGKSGTGRGRGTWMNWLAGLSLAGGFVMLYAGVLFILETNKGQLVIDSQVDVQVKIVSVDEAGNRKPVDELQIEPGTKTTRLRSGKYEITLDSASDSFGVTNEVFTIRNGQTVVATITPRPEPAQPSEPGSPGFQPEQITQDRTDPRLDQLVYDGQSLATWLGRLRNERNPAEIDRALEAIVALSDEELRGLIEPAIVDYIVSRPNYRPHEDFRAVLALFNCCGADFPIILARIASNMKDTLSAWFILSTSSKLLMDTVSIESYQELHDSLVALLSVDNPDVVQDSARLFCALADTASSQGFAPELQAQTLQILLNTEALTDQNFWLAFPKELSIFYFAERYGEIVNESFTTTGGSHRLAEVARRATAVLDDEHASDQLQTQAVIVLRTILESDFELTEAQQADMIRGLARVIVQAIGDPSLALIKIELPQELSRYVAPLLEIGRFNVDPRIPSRGHKLITTLNLVTVAEVQDKIQTELETLHGVFRQLPLQGKDFADRLANPGRLNWRELIASGPGEPGYLSKSDLFINQVIYLQSGFLLGKSQEELFARFEQQLPADIAHRVNSLLDQLVGHVDSRHASNLLELNEIMPPNFSPRAVEVLESFAARNALVPLISRRGSVHENPVQVLTEVWLRAAGGEFLASFARALRNSDSDNQAKLLKVDFIALEEFRCTEPTQLEPLLAWADEELASRADADLDEYAEAIIDLLSRFALDKNKVSTACQRRVVEQLENIQSLSNRNYWFSEVHIDRRYGQPWRVAQLRRAIEVLQDESPDADGTLLCHSLITIRAGLEDLDEDLKQLPEEYRENLIASLRSRLQAATKELDTHTQMCPIALWFGKDAPPIFNSTATAERPSTRPTSPPLGESRFANATILLLNLLIDSWKHSENSLFIELKNQVEELHQAVAGLNIMAPGFGAMLSEVIGSDPIFGIEVFASKSLPPGLIQHTWFVQSGSLLGKNLQELIQRPSRLSRAERERKARFVQPGDTLAIHIPGVLPQSGEPPVIQAGTAAPVTGFPVPVSAEGTIQLPLLPPHLPPLEVKDLELDQVREKIIDAYDEIGSRGLIRGVYKRTTVQFLLRAGQQVELRNIAGNSPITLPKE